MNKFYFLALAGALALSASAQDVKSRAALAAGLSTETVDGKVTLNYTITGNTATAANVQLLNGETVVKTIELTDIAQGAHSVELDLSDVAEGAYTYAVEVSSNVAGSDPVQVYTRPIYTNYVYATGSNGTRTGITMFNDPESDYYGYAVAVNNAPQGKSAGVEFIAPDGKITVYQKDTLLPLVTSHVSAYARYNQVLISSWSDSGSGIYFLNMDEPDQQPEQLFAGFRDSDGKFTKDGEDIGGSIGGMALTIDGTKLYTFDEEVNHNTANLYVLGDEELTAECIKAGPSWKSSFIVGGDAANGASGAPDTPITTTASVATASSPDGFMISVNRWANGAAWPGYIFWNPEKDAGVYYSDGNLFKSSGCGVAFNSDYSLFARMGYTGNGEEVTIHEVKWVTKAGMRIPEFGPAIYTIPSSTTFGQICFDAADNVYISNNKQGTATTYQYAVYALPGKRTVKTPAKTTDLINVSGSGLNDVTVEAEDVAPVYYNLQGVKVENPANGIFIEVRGAKATKVVK